MIKYCANYMTMTVTPVEVLEESEQYLWLKDGKGISFVLKHTNYRGYFDSRKEAVAYLRRKAEIALYEAERVIDGAKEEFRLIRLLEERER